MKVLQINSVCGKGSTGRIATDLLRFIEAKGHTGIIAYGRDAAPADIPAISITNSKLGQYAHVAMTRLFDAHGLASSRATHQLLNKIASYKPDIIHLHNLHGYYINYEILFAFLRSYNRPVLWTLHDCWAFTGHCAYFDAAGCEKWRTGCTGGCIQSKGYPSTILHANAAANFKRKRKAFTSVPKLELVTPSKWLGNLARESFLSAHPVHVIYNGLDLETFSPRPSDIRKKYDCEGKFLILGVANVWEERKGLKDFIALSQRLPGEFKILLVGLSEKQKNSLPKNIIGILRTESALELAELYTTCDVFFNPSIEEAMGLVTVEAFACGTPAIVYNATAVPEMVHPTCGMVVDKNKIDEVEAIIRKMHAGDIVFSASDCRNHALTFEKDAAWQQYLSLYEKMTAQSASLHNSKA